MPHTDQGIWEARCKFPGVEVGFCDQYEEDYYNPRLCGARQMCGVRSHNWCMRCPCGYIALNLTEKQQEATRL